MYRRRAVHDGVVLEELEDERSLFPDEFVGLDDDEHPQPFASALWLAFLRLPR